MIENDIREIEWGDDSAEHDNNILNYFIKPQNFSRARNLKKTFIIGRKGAGKTAIKRKLISEFKAENNHIVIELSPTNGIFRNMAGIKLLKEERSDEIIFQYAWLNSILRKCLNTIGSISTNKLTVGSASAARQFAIDEGVSNLDFIESTGKILKAIKLKAGEIGELGLQLENQIKESSSIDSYEFHLVELAKDQCKTTILIDDLDIGWDNSNRSNDILLGLLTASMYLKALHKNINVLFFMRDDMYSILMKKTTHSDKYRDTFPILWNKDSFHDLLSERIRDSLNIDKEVATSECFSKVFPDSIGRTETLKWMTERTLDRPRELIQLARLYTENLEENEPDADTLKNVEALYSQWKREDVCSEFLNQYPNLDNIFEYWSKEFYRTKYQIDESTFTNRMEKILNEVHIKDDWFTKIKEENDTYKLGKVLFDIGFIGDYIRGGDGGNKVHYFGNTASPLLKEVQIHPCFRKSVGTVSRNR